MAFCILLQHKLVDDAISVFIKIDLLVYSLDLQKNQRYNISEDTWRQVLAFSRCVHENLEGYDPEGIVFICHAYTYYFSGGETSYKHFEFLNVLLIIEIVGE